MDKLTLVVNRLNFNKTSDYKNNFEKRSSLIEKTDGSSEKIPKNEYCNRENFNIDNDGTGLKISFNPNKINNKYYGDVINFNEFTETIEYIESSVNECGVDFNIKQANIYRIDNNFDVFTEFDYKSYEQVIKNMSPLMRNGKEQDYGDTVYYGNNSSKIVIYDKQRQLLDYKKIEIPENVMRIEIRRSKQRIPLGYLLNENSFYTQRSNDKKYISKNIFIRNPEIIENETFNLLGSLIRKGLKPNEINKQLAIYLINRELKKLGMSMLKFKETFKTNRKNPNYQNTNNFIKGVGKTIPCNDYVILNLYNELREKFLKIA